MEEKMEHLSLDSKITVLLNLMEFQFSELRRREEHERLLFQWTTGLLLAVFAAIFALSDGNTSLPPALALPLRLLATTMIVSPAVLSILWIFRLSSNSLHNTRAIERLQELLCLFDAGVYGSSAPYPIEWRGGLTGFHLKRKTPIYFAFMISIMTMCVVVAIWLATL